MLDLLYSQNAIVANGWDSSNIILVVNVAGCGVDPKPFFFGGESFLRCD